MGVMKGTLSPDFGVARSLFPPAGVPPCAPAFVELDAVGFRSSSSSISWILLRKSKAFLASSSSSFSFSSSFESSIQSGGGVHPFGTLYGVPSTLVIFPSLPFDPILFAVSGGVIGISSGRPTGLDTSGVRGGLLPSPSLTFKAFIFLGVLGGVAGRLLGCVDLPLEGYHRPGTPSFATHQTIIVMRITPMV